MFYVIPRGLKYNSGAWGNSSETEYKRQKWECNTYLKICSYPNSNNNDNDNDNGNCNDNDNDNDINNDNDNE